MANKSKAKGNRFERQIVELCTIWDTKAVRAWGSNGKSLGMHEEVDVLIEDDFRVQQKKLIVLYLKKIEGIFIL